MVQPVKYVVRLCAYQPVARVGHYTKLNVSERIVGGCCRRSTGVRERHVHGKTRVRAHVNRKHERETPSTTGTVSPVHLENGTTVGRPERNHAEPLRCLVKTGVVRLEEYV